MREYIQALRFVPAYNSDIRFYLFAYHIGKWNQLTSLYQKILKKADDEGFVLSGYAYERGISELSLFSCIKAFSTLSLNALYSSYPYSNCYVNIVD